MDKIGITEVREILSKVIREYDGLYKIGFHTPDDELLKMNLYTDFGLGSLDIEDMFSKLYDLYGISVDIHNPLIEYPFNKEQTVENFIDTVNYHLSIKA